MKSKIFMEKTHSKLSFAIQIIDNYSKSNPLGNVEVYIEGLKKPLKNPSGYYLFFDVPDSSGLPDGKYTIKVESEYYFNDSLDLKVQKDAVPPVPDPKIPQPIHLDPKPHYPFSPGTTLIRGMVYVDKKPVSGAEVNLIEKSLKTKTTEKGEYVFYITDKDLIGDEKTDIKVNYQTYEKTNEVDILEGKTSVLEIELNS